MCVYDSHTPTIFGFRIDQLDMPLKFHVSQRHTLVDIFQKCIHTYVRFWMVEFKENKWDTFAMYVSKESFANIYENVS